MNQRSFAVSVATTDMQGAISETGLRPNSISDYSSEKSGKLGCTENKDKMRADSDSIINNLDENAEDIGTFDEPDGSVDVVDFSVPLELDQEISRLQQESEMLREDLCKSSIEKEQFASQGTETSNVADQAESDGMEKVNLASGEQDVHHRDIKGMEKDQFESEVAKFQLGENNTDQFESGVSIPGLFDYDEMIESMLETDTESQDKGEIRDQQGDERVQDHLSVEVTGASNDKNDALNLKLIEVKAEDTIETIKDKEANEVDVEDNTEIREETETSDAFELEKIEEKKVGSEASETSGTKRRENNVVVADDLIMKKEEVNALEVSHEPVSSTMEEVENPVIHKEETELDREKKLKEQLRESNVESTQLERKKVVPMGDKQRDEIRKIGSSQESITSQLSSTGCPGENDPQISDEEPVADVKEMKRVKRFKMPYWLKKTKHGVLNSLSMKTELKEDQPDIGQDRQRVSSRVRQLLHAKKDSAVTKDLADLPAESHVRNVDDLDSRGKRVIRSLSLSESCLRPRGGSLSSSNSLAAGLGRRVVTLGRVRGRQVVQSLRDWGSQITPAGQDFENIRYKVGQSSFYLLSDGADPSVGCLYFNKSQPPR
jgi:hypothetical protein